MAADAANPSSHGQNLVLVEQAPTRIPLAEGSPDEYIVQDGDTLWDIAATFLRDPWYWPEVWYVNPQIENPHLIHPGDRIWITPSEMRRVSEERVVAAGYRLAGWIKTALK